jgi:hypothetical protein
LHNAARRSIGICLKDTKAILSCDAKNSWSELKMLQLQQNDHKWCIFKHQNRAQALFRGITVNWERL